jgi:hypothetical protein
MADSQNPELLGSASLDLRRRLDGYQEHSVDLARMREDVFAAADRESGEIIAGARAEIRRIVLKARRDLVVLRDQVHAAIERDADNKGKPAVPLRPVVGNAPETLVATGQAAWRMLDEARTPPEPASSVSVEDPATHSRSRPVSIRPLVAMATLVGVAAMFGTGMWIASLDERTTATPAAIGTSGVESGSEDPDGTRRSKAPGVTAANELAHVPATSSLPASADTPHPADPTLSGGEGSPEVGGLSKTSADAVRNQLASSAERWLDAYYVQDRNRMAALSSPDVAVTDARAQSERLPGGLTAVQRTVTTPRVQVFGGAAVLTATVTERADDPAAGRPAESVSFISQTWTFRQGAWQLNEVRIVSASALDRAFRR